VPDEYQEHVALGPGTTSRCEAKARQAPSGKAERLELVEVTQPARPPRRSKPLSPGRGRPPSTGPVFEAVVTYVDGLILDELGDARAAIALSLALSIDQASSRRTPGMVKVAVPEMTKQLRAALDELSMTTATKVPYLTSVSDVEGA